MRLLLLLLLLPLHALAQPGPPLSDGARASLVTIRSGDELFTAWGHTALRVRDPQTGVDVFYNYGTFDFDQPNFYLNFARGFLLYALSKEPPGRMLRVYEFVGRSVIEQHLALSPDEVRALYARLEDNYREANRNYLYDFLRDNCSTRPRDQIEAVLGERLVWTDLPDPGLTFRELLDTGLHPRPWSDFGLDLLLGARLDHEATPYEATFLPEFLREAFDTATVRDTTGALTPLVVRTDTLIRVPVRSDASPFPWPTVLAWLMAGAALAHLLWSLRGGHSDPRLQRGLDMLLFGAVGAIGVVMALLWFATEHYVTTHNWGLAWALPTHLGAALLLLWQPGMRALRTYWAFTAVAGAVLLLLWWAVPQALHPAVFPLVVTLTLRAARRTLPLARNAAVVGV